MPLKVFEQRVEFFWRFILRRKQCFGWIGEARGWSAGNWLRAGAPGSGNEGTGDGQLAEMESTVLAS